MAALQEAIDRYITKPHDKAKKIFDPLVTAFDMDYFFRFSVTNQGLFSATGTDADWADVWVDERLYLHDKMYTHPKHISVGANLFGKGIRDGYVSDKFFSITRADLVSGVRYIKKTPTGYLGYGFATKRHPHNIFLNHLGFFDGFIKHFEEKMEKTIWLSEQDPVDLKSLVKEQWINPALNPSNNVFVTPYFKLIGQPDLITCYELTEREKEVLDVYALGYTAKAVGALLHIGRRTVESHIANAKNKLGCQSKDQLINLYRQWQKYQPTKFGSF